MPLLRPSLTPCASFHDRVSALAAGRVAPREAVALAAHAAACPDCAGTLGHERRFEAMMRRHANHEVQFAPAALRSRVAQLFDTHG
ncbi:MAG: hypothetical protein JWO05_2163 [Gemmatimonadetes bacterium]|nr:hypothetical protein [Gemmatimonadota bacterium]